MSKFGRSISALLKDFHQLRSTGRPTFEAVSVLAKEAMLNPRGVQAVSQLVPIIQTLNTRRLDERKIISCIVNTSLKNVTEMIKENDASSLKSIIVWASDDQFLHFLSAVNDYMTQLHLGGITDIPPALVQVLPEIEGRMIRTSSMTPETVDIIATTVARLKLANVDIFKQLVKEILVWPKEEMEKNLKPAVVLKLIREMGWAGCTHSDFLHAVIPLFSRFRNYQAMSSVWILAGGLDKRIVEYCMSAIRRDYDRRNDVSHSHSIGIESHCAIIRRLVTCGFFEEAMELFSHFPPTDYLNLTSKNAVSQIQRLFLASFVDPVTVPVEKIAFLKPDGVKHELTFSTFRGGEQSSYIHTLAVTALNGLKVEHISELVDEPTQLVVDIYVPSKNLAIEVQGPSHYITDLKTGERRLRPEDDFKISVLKARGYQVAILSIHDFGRNNATRNAENCIAELLSRYPDS